MLNYSGLFTHHHINDISFCIAIGNCSVHIITFVTFSTVVSWCALKTCLALYMNRISFFIIRTSLHQPVGAVIVVSVFVELATYQCVLVPQHHS